MVAVRFRDTESCEPEPQLLWDTVWVQRLDASGGYGDWIMASLPGPSDAHSHPVQVESLGGLRAEAALHTATLLCLFTDRRLPEGRSHPSSDSDPRGWWGNSIRLEGEPEVEMGSLLWAFERAVLNERLGSDAEDVAREALAVLVTQGAVARTDVAATVDRRQGALMLEVAHWSHAGTRVYEQRFGVLWQQSARNAQMNYGDRAF
jgi:phage gp46-like protein